MEHLWNVNLKFSVTVRQIKDIFLEISVNIRRANISVKSTGPNYRDILKLKMKTDNSY